VSPPAALADADRRLVARLRRRQRPLLVVAVALTLLGGAYGVWAAEELRRAPAMNAHAFDRPVARIGVLLAARAERLAQLQPRTEREGRLRDELALQTRYLAALGVAMLRFLLALGVLTAGLLLLTAWGTQRPLLRVLARLDPDAAA
jgi:hypothetical protein